MPLALCRGGGSLAAGSTYSGATYASASNCTPVSLTCTAGVLNYPDAVNSCSASDPAWANVSGLFHMEDLTDASGRSTVSFNGTPTFSATTYKVGGRALYLDGAASYLTVPDSDNFWLNSDFTVEAWVYIGGSTTSIQTLVNQRYSGGVGTQFTLTYTGGKYYQSAWADGVWAIPRNTGMEIPVAQWVHLAWVRSGTSLKTFVNGAVNHSVTYSNIPANVAAPLTLGGDAAGFNQHFTGYLDEVRITRGVARYSTSFTPSTTEFPNH